MKNYFCLTFLFFLGCSNVLKETGKTNTPQAILFSAKEKMNTKDYDGAISLLQTLDPTYLAQRDVALIYASAYSGRCGLDFFNLLGDLESIGSSPIFLFMMTTFPGGTVAKEADCVTSETALNNIGAYTARTGDENILMGLSSFTKIGTILSTYADIDVDGTTDAGFDHCSATDLPDDAVREIGTGLANALLSISQVGASIGGGSLSSISSVCSLDPSLNAFCTNTDKNTYTALEVKVLRAIIGSNDLGIASCVGSFANVACLCP